MEIMLSAFSMRPWSWNLRTRPDLSELEQLEAESFDLGEDAEHRSLIFKPAGEHGLAAHQLR